MIYQNFIYALGWVGFVTEKNKLHMNCMRVLDFHRRGSWSKLEINERERNYRVIWSSCQG